MNWNGESLDHLTNDQASTLFDHLCLVLNRNDAEFAVHDIDMGCVDFILGMADKKKRADKKVPLKPHYLDGRIDELRTRLADHHSSGDKNKRIKNHDLYWRVVFRLGSLLEEQKSSRWRGRSPREERSNLLRRIWDHYPYEIRGMAKTKVHFGATVKMVLGFVNERVPYRSDMLSDALRGYG